MRLKITMEYKKEQTATRNALKKWLKRNKRPVYYVAEQIGYNRSGLNRWVNRKGNLGREPLNNLQKFIEFEYEPISETDGEKEYKNKYLNINDKCLADCISFVTNELYSINTDAEGDKYYTFIRTENIIKAKRKILRIKRELSE